MYDLKTRLKTLRKEKDVTQKELADIIGVSRDQILNWEVGRGNPNLEVLNKLSNYFKVSTDYLLGKSPFKNSKEADCSIRIAAIKKALINPEYRIFIWNRAFENIETEFGFTKETRQYVKILLNKEVFTDIEYYDLSLFVAWDIEWPEDFNGPAILGIWETKIPCDIDYWSIPKIIVEEWKSNIKYKEVIYDDPMPSVEECFGNEDFSEYLPPNKASDRELLEQIATLTGKIAIDVEEIKAQISQKDGPKNKKVEVK